MKISTGNSWMWKRIRCEKCHWPVWTSLRKDERDSLRSCWRCTRKIEHSRWSRNWAIQRMESKSGEVARKSEPAHRGRYRAMLMQLLQFPFAGDRGQALEEWERLVRQCEAQSSDTLQDTIKAAILAHNPQDPEWRRHVGLNTTRLQGYDALRIEWKAMHQAYRQWSIADGNDTTPMEVDALNERQRQEQRQRQGQREGQR